MLSYTFKYHLRSGMLLSAMFLMMIVMFGALFKVEYNIALIVPFFFMSTYLEPLRLSPTKPILIKISETDCAPIIRAAHIAFGTEMLIAYIIGRSFILLPMLGMGYTVRWVREVTWLLQNIELNLVVLMVGVACSLSDLASIRNIIKRKLACNFLLGLVMLILSVLLMLIGLFDKMNIGLSILLLITLAIWYCYTGTLKKLVYYIHFEQ